MEAVAAHVILLIVLVGDGVDVGLGGHGHVESGVEHGHLGGVGHDGLAGPDAHEVGGVVEGAQGDALLDGGDARVVDDAALSEGHAAVEHPVADGGDLVGGGDNAVDRVHHDVQHRLDGLAVGGHGDLPDHVLTAGDLVGQTAVDADALAQTLGEDLAALRLHELVLQRGAAGVDDQNFHGFTSPCPSVVIELSFFVSTL